MNLESDQNFESLFLCSREFELWSYLNKYFNSLSTFFKVLYSKSPVREQDSAALQYAIESKENHFTAAS